MTAITLENTAAWNEAQADRAERQRRFGDAKRHRANATRCWLQAARKRRGEQ